MALTADEKEKIMAARGESQKAATGKTRLYTPIIDGKRITMISLSGLSEEEARLYCIDKFGEKRFGGFASE